MHLFRIDAVIGDQSHHDLEILQVKFVPVKAMLQIVHSALLVLIDPSALLIATATHRLLYLAFEHLNLLAKFVHCL